MTAQIDDIPVWALEFARLEHRLEKAIEVAGGGYTLEDLFIGLSEGNFQLWTRNNTIGITQIVDEPQVRSLNVFLAGGDMADLQALLPKVEAFAGQEGCTRITLGGRKGWSKSFLRAAGFEPRWVVLAKELD